MSARSRGWPGLQRILDVPEDRVEGIRRRRRLLDGITNNRIVRRRLRGQRVQVRRPRLDRVGRHNLTVEERPELSTRLLMSSMLVLKSPTTAWVPSTKRCRARTQATDRLSGLVQQHQDLVGGQGRTDPAHSVERRPDLAGTVPLVMECSGGEVLVGFAQATQVEYCSPTADTECTLAMESTGTLYLSLMLIVGAHRSRWASTLRHLPIVTPR